MKRHKMDRKYRPAPKYHADWIAEMQKLPGVFIPMRTSTPGNNPQHRMTQARITKRQRELVTVAMRGYGWGVPPAGTFRDGLRVQYTRYSPREVDRFGNLPSCFKFIHDSVCAFYGVDDRDKRWDVPEPIQVKTKAGCYGIRIEITPNPILEI